MISSWQHLLDEIRDCEKKFGRSPYSVRLLAVSKNQPVEKIRPLLQLGHTWFGENRVQEAYSKWPLLLKEFPLTQLHLIGPLQTNKISQALSLFDTIETLDRPSLVTALAQKWSLQSRTKEFFIQVNTGTEPQKAGVHPDKLRELFFVATEQAHLPVTGLMCIPPLHEDPIPHFKLLADLAKDYSLPHLSMGMSHDFPAAIACGSTFIRLGTRIFGERG